MNRFLGSLAHAGSRSLPRRAVIGGFVVLANLLIDQIAAGLPEAQTLGTDTFRASPDGKIKSLVGNGPPQTELRFQQTERPGPGPFDFRE